MIKLLLFYFYFLAALLESQRMNDFELVTSPVASRKCRLIQTLLHILGELCASLSWHMNGIDIVLTVISRHSKD